MSKMEDPAEQTVRGPGGVEVVISFLSNNEILVRVPPSFVVRNDNTVEVVFPCSHMSSSFDLAFLPQRNGKIKRRQQEESKEEGDGSGNVKKLKLSLTFNAGILESLPVELHHLLFDWLPFDTLAHLNEVCAFWKAVLDDEILWRRRYTILFGPLSRCRLTLPLPPHLCGAVTTTSTKVLKWKKRFVLMRNLSQCSGPDLGFIQSWRLLHGCSRLPKLGNWYGGVDPKPEIALSAILVDDIKLLEETLRSTNLSYHPVSKTTNQHPFLVLLTTAL